MQIKPRVDHTYEDGSQSMTFDIMTKCCDELRDFINDDYTEKMYDEKDGVSIGHGHDFWINHVKYCWICGEKIYLL